MSLMGRREMRCIARVYGVSERRFRYVRGGRVMIGLQDQED
jgi:hypothetical protein